MANSSHLERFGELREEIHLVAPLNQAGEGSKDDCGVVEPLSSACPESEPRDAESSAPAHLRLKRGSPRSDDGILRCGSEAQGQDRGHLRPIPSPFNEGESLAHTAQARASPGVVARVLPVEDRR